MSLGSEIYGKGNLPGKEGEFFLGPDLNGRSSFSSNPSKSQYLNIDGYTLANGGLGYRGNRNFSIFIWAKNLFGTDYFEQLLPAGGM